VNSLIVALAGWLVSCRGFRGFAIRIVSLTVLLIFALLIAGCGKDAGASIATPKPAKKRATPAATSSSELYNPTSTPYPTLTPAPTSVPTVKPTRVHKVLPTATSAPAPSVPPGRVLSALLQPLNVEPQARLDASVQTSGSVDQIDLYLGSGVPGSSGPITVTLTQGAAGSWSGVLTAPAQPGVYHYTVGLYSGGKRTVIDNNNWNIKVLQASTAAGPLPDNIPLVPPFNWGNPVAASFQADGRTISGSEVVSNTRTDVPASYVARWYTNRLPASGWTIVPSTLPAQGASSFTIVANSASQVCVVQYAAGTVHIFYG
jgi:hypothetical protein